MEEHGSTIDRMAEFVSGRGSRPGVDAGREGADWQGQLTADGVGSEPKDDTPPLPPVPTDVAPKLLGLDLESGLLFTNIGNFRLGKEQNRIIKSCLRIMKSELAGTYTRLRRELVPAPVKPARKMSTKRKYRRRKATSSVKSS